MYIKSVRWIDKEAKEAEVVISDNNYELLCFSHPFTKNVGEKLEEPISCLNVEDVFKAFKEEVYVVKYENYFSYSIRGLLYNKKDKIVLVGDIKLSLEDEYIPNDLREGEYIEFKVSRLDLY